jgi:hypothetical protein
MIHPDTKIASVNKIVGFGIFATKHIPKGTIVWVGDPLDLHISWERWQSLPPTVQQGMQKYIYPDGNGYVVNWDHARYMNHSCEPNCLGARNFYIAVRDIPPGAELSDDYSCYYHEAFQPFDCACQRPSCRSRIFPSDIRRLGAKYDSLIAESLRHIGNVPQPLRPLLSEAGKQEIEASLSGKVAISLYSESPVCEELPSEEKNT